MVSYHLPDFLETHTELKVASKAADIPESDKISEGDECTENEDKSCYCYCYYYY